MVLVAVSVALVDCALVTDLNDLRGVASGDATSDGAGTDVEAGEITDGGDASLLPNGDFEQGTAGCGPGWIATNGTLTRSSTAHSGAASCEVCVSAGDWTNVHASPRPVVDPPASATYSAQVWLKVEDSSVVSEVALDIEESTQGGTLAWQPGDPANTTWQLVQASTKPAVAGGTDVDFSVHLILNDGGAGCVLIDDAELVRQ